MFGQNVIRKQNLDDPHHLRVQDIFLTIQGEGPYAGVPAVFIRLAGCNLACTFCDTDFESNYDNLMSLTDITVQVWDKLKDTRVWLLVLTGGEPLLQPIGELIESLLQRTTIRHVQIETAGTVWQDGLEQFIVDGTLSLVCSPKTPKVNGVVAAFCHDWKYIIREGQTSPTDGLPCYSTQADLVPAMLYRPTRPHDTIWVQACDEGLGQMNFVRTEKNQKACIQIATKYGYRLSYQLHKALSLP